MSSYVHCEECRKKRGVEDMGRAWEWYVLQTGDGSKVGDYCSPACLLRGAEGWEAVKAEPAEDDE